ncbi:hypothetical protein [Nocardioides dubius]|uniref:hypothetical protein n=1 Tax=Nocardioides dubius TaxID=317019 RepID=UPI0031DA0603
MAELAAKVPGLDLDAVMLVGAQCRDVLHVGLGHAFGTRSSFDVDLGLALRSWDDHREVTQACGAPGANGIQYRVAGLPVDLLPFGEVEEPAGLVTPPERKEALSVWAFAEVYQESRSLPLGGSLHLRIPTVPGYAAIKLAAWLDRSAYGQYKDAVDLALVMLWYRNHEGMLDRLYEQHPEVMADYDYDLTLAAAALLGMDAMQVVGAARAAELRARWPRTSRALEELAGELRPSGDEALPVEERLPRARRLELAAALADGLFR